MSKAPKVRCPTCNAKLTQAQLASHMGLHHREKKEESNE